MSELNNTNYETDNDNIYNNLTEDVALFIHTKKVSAIKSLIEALKEIFTNVNIKFTPKAAKPLESDPTKFRITGGLSITALNSNQNILVKLQLDADKFCHYKCIPESPKNCIMLGVNMSNLFKLIKNLGNDDELFIMHNRTNQNQISLQYLNKTKSLTTTYYLNLLDLNEDNLVIAKQKFDFVITMPSNDFHTLIKNMSGLADKVDIKFSNVGSSYTLSFSCQGEFASQETVFYGSPNLETSTENKLINVEKNETDSEDENKEDNIIQGVYELKALSLFSRCSSLCPTIQLYIHNNSPLVIKYKVADMGSVHLILSPSNIDEINNDSDNESNDDEED